MKKDKEELRKNIQKFQFHKFNQIFLKKTTTDLLNAVTQES